MTIKTDWSGVKEGLRDTHKKLSSFPITKVEGEDYTRIPDEMAILLGDVSELMLLAILALENEDSS